MRAEKEKSGLGGVRAEDLGTGDPSSEEPVLLPRSLLRECPVGRGVSEEVESGRLAQGQEAPDRHLGLCHPFPCLADLT